MKAQSARALFRATKSKRLVPVDREADDFYPTPPEPTRALLSAERGRLSAFPVIWEPAAGDGAMAREIAAMGFSVHCSDLVDRGCGAELRDFFEYETAPAPAIVTNPPYFAVNARDGKARWIWHAMDALGVEYMALFLNWAWPGAGGLARVWTEWPPARVYLCRWKVDFTGEGAPPNLNGWFVWDREHEGEPVLRVLDRGQDARQEALV